MGGLEISRAMLPHSNIVQLSVMYSVYSICQSPSCSIKQPHKQSFLDRSVKSYRDSKSLVVNKGSNELLKEVNNIAVIKIRATFGS